MLASMFNKLQRQHEDMKTTRACWLTRVVRWTELCSLLWSVQKTLQGKDAWWAVHPWPLFNNNQGLKGAWEAQHDYRQGIANIFDLVVPYWFVWVVSCKLPYEQDFVQQGWVKHAGDCWKGLEEFKGHCSCGGMDFIFQESLLGRRAWRSKRRRTCLNKKLTRSRL